MEKVKVERWTVALDDQGGLHVGAQLEPQELPDEWVNRALQRIDLSDDAAIVALLEKYGLISRPYFDRGSVPLDVVPLLAPMTDDDEDDWWASRGDGTIEDVRWWLHTARALVGVWAGAFLGRSIEAWAEEGFTGIFNEEDSWAQFTLCLDVGLSAFHARAEYHRDFGGRWQHTYGSPVVDLYSAACSQIFNYIVGDETARRCANETCKSPVFIHQFGSAKRGQYRSAGVLMYCSKECQSQQTSRKWRRKVAAEKEASRGR